MSRFGKICLLACAIGWIDAPATALAEDPLDSADGTEAWDEIDTSAVDEAAAWQSWRADLRRWEAGRVRLDAEQARSSQLRAGGGSPPPDGDSPDAQRDVDPQERIEAARRESRSGGPDQRDDDGQVLDDERPWSRR